MSSAVFDCSFYLRVFPNQAKPPLAQHNLRPFPLLCVTWQRDWSPPGSILLSGSCRKREDSPRASFSPGYSLSVLCSSPFPSFVPFSGHAPAWETQIWVQDWRCGLPSVQHRRTNTGHSVAAPRDAAKWAQHLPSPAQALNGSRKCYLLRVGMLGWVAGGTSLQAFLLQELQGAECQLWRRHSLLVWT